MRYMIKMNKLTFFKRVVLVKMFIVSIIEYSTRTL